VALILTANEVGDLLILGLLDGGFVVLRSLAEDVLLNGVDTYQDGFRLVPNNFHHPGRSATNTHRTGKCMPGNPTIYRHQQPLRKVKDHDGEAFSPAA